jgi:hypothetical protein
MPSLFNRSQVNAFGFPVGNNGEVDETRATVQPQARPLVNEPQKFLNDFTSRFQGASGGYGAFSPFVKYLSGQGDLSIGENDSKDKPLSQFSIGPGGMFNLQNLQNGFSVSGDPRSKSLSMYVPVNIGGNKGTVGVEGSWNSFDPSIGAKFAFGQGKQPVVDNSEQQLNAALGVNQTYNADKKVYSEPYTSPELSGRALYNQMLSYTDDKNYSPAAALSNYYGQGQPGFSY